MLTRRLIGAIETVAALFLLAIALLTAGNVAVRAAFNVQIPDWFDGSKLLLGIALFWGIAVATYHAGHICVDIVWEHLKPRGRRWLDLVAALITLGFLAPTAWMVTTKVLASGTQATTDLRLPIMGFNLVASAGAAAAVLLAALRAWQLLRGHEPPAEPPGSESLAGALGRDAEALDERGPHVA